jgi:hypothetical protein
MAPIKALALLTLFSASKVLAATFMSMAIAPVITSTPAAVINTPIDQPPSTSFAVPFTSALTRFVTDIIPTSSNGLTIQTSALTNSTIVLGLSTTLLVPVPGNATATGNGTMESGLPTTVLTTTVDGSRSSRHLGTKTTSASASPTTGAAGKVGVGAAVGFGALLVGLVGA